MSGPLSAEQLAEYAARTEAASKGPWGSHRDLNGVYTIEVNPRVIPGFGSVSEGDVAQILTRDDAHAYADARFIAMAREAVPALLVEVERLQAELAKYVGHEPTLAEEALYVHEQQVRARIAQDVNRADKPRFAASEDPELVVKTTRAIDIRLIEMGADAPYWVPEGGEPPIKGESTQPTQDRGSYERVTVVLAPESSAALARAAEITGDTRTDTVNRAIQAYALMTGEVSDGGRVFIERPEGGESR